MAHALFQAIDPLVDPTWRIFRHKLTTIQSPQTPAYSVSKWAIRGLTQVSAMDLAQHGITVNAYCPGMVRTDMWETIDSNLSTQMGVPKGVVFEKAVESRIASKRPQVCQRL